MGEAFGHFVQRCLMAIELNVDGIIVNVNDNYLRVSGYEAQELIGQPYDSLCSAAYRATAEYKALRQAWLGGERFSCLGQRQRKNGLPFWMEITYNPIFDENGWPLGTVAVGRDATEGSEAQTEDSAKNEAIHQSLLVAEYALDGRLIRANQTYLDTFQVAAEDVIGQSRHIFHPKDHVKDPRFRQAWDYVLAGNIYTAQWECLSPDDSSIWLEGVYTPIYDGGGKMVKIMLFGLNVTWRVLQELREKESLKRLALVCDRSASPVLMVDRDNQPVYINESFVRLLGYSREELSQGGAGMIFGPGEMEVVSKIRAASQRDQAISSEEIVYSKNGHRSWVICSISQIDDSEGGPLLIVALTDITRVKMNELVQSTALEAMVVDRPIPEMLTLVCREVERITPEAIVCITSVDRRRRLSPLAHASLPPACADAITGRVSANQIDIAGGACSLGEAVMIDDIKSAPEADGEVREVFLKAGIMAFWSIPIKSGTGELLGAVTFYYQKSMSPDNFQKQLAEIVARLCAIALEREKIRYSMRRLTFYDNLTGLPNRGFFLTNAERMLEGAKKSGSYMTLFVISVDRMKVFNETLGHDNGDKILRSVSQALQGRWSQPTELMGRLAGDDLALALAGGDSVVANAVAREIQALVSRPLTIDNLTITPTVTIGICIYPTNGDDVDNMIHNAFLAISKARRSGFGRLSFFCAEQDQVSQKSLAMESALRQAIGSPEMSLSFQPQIGLRNGQLHGAEALIRWSSPEFGYVPPDSFISVMERSGLIARLSEWVLAESCRALSRWRQKGFMIPSISVNLSASNFSEPDFLDKIFSCLEANSLSPGDLILELTEGVFMDPDSATMEVIHQAFQSGLRFSVDDFGTGYSCLSYLHRLPISELKLDRSFVMDFQESDTSRRISQAIMGIGQSLDMTLVAEGVETREQFQLLKDQGWHAAQGYLFSQALPNDEFENWLATYPNEAVKETFIPQGGIALSAPSKTWALTVPKTTKPAQVPAEKLR